VFWASAEGAIAATLLHAGGLDGLKSAAICLGLPFCIVLIFVCIGLARALRRDRQQPAAQATAD
jgi:choline/glycine/proline betaine transport protein